MSREKVSISLDKDEKSLRTFNLQHMVKAVPLTLWRLTSFLSCSHLVQTRYAFQIEQQLPNWPMG